jgi:hypothetical protein
MIIMEPLVTTNHWIMPYHSVWLASAIIDLSGTEFVIKPLGSMQSTVRNGVVSSSVWPYWHYITLTSTMTNQDSSCRYQIPAESVERKHDDVTMWNGQYGIRILRLLRLGESNSSSTAISTSHDGIIHQQDTTYQGAVIATSTATVDRSLGKNDYEYINMVFLSALLVGLPFS